MKKDNKSKKNLGQYFTINNPFEFNLFKEWSKNIKENDILLEPFAGSNNIVKLIKDVGINNNWKCYDIDNTNYNQCPEYPIIQNDSIKNFPNGFRVSITNPPYLAKVSASRQKLDYPNTKYADLYMLCLEKILNNCEYVAAIIPESFITQDLFIDRLFGIISLNIKMFNDTDCPVCLALFSPKQKNKCINICVGNENIGNLYDLKKHNLHEYYNMYTKWKFNDKNGIIGVKCVDNTITDNIYFLDGNLINADNIKISSRSFSRISGIPKDIDMYTFINKCNDILKEYRLLTKDVFMTSFKNLRVDKKYRRRIDFKTIRCIMNKSLYELGYNHEISLF